MTTVAERVDSAGERDRLVAALQRQRRAFLAEGPPSFAVRRDRIGGVARDDSAAQGRR